MRTIGAISNKLLYYKKYVITFFAILFFHVMAFAQRMDDQHVTTEFNYDSREMPWYAQPWIWAIVASVLILLIAFLSKDTLKRHMENDSEAGTTH